MIEQTIMYAHNGCPHSTPYEPRDLALTIADEKQITPRVPHSLSFNAFSSICSLNICMLAWPKAVLNNNRLLA